MATYEVNAPDGKKYKVNAPEGASEQDAIKYVQDNFYGATKVDMPVPKEPIGSALNREIADIPRQLGLTARHGIEGVGNTLDMLASPFRAGLNAVLPGNLQAKGSTGKAIADVIGLPEPRTKIEKIVAQPTQLLAGGAGLLGGARAASSIPGMTGEVAKMLAANPAQQLQAAVGAGAAGGLVKETGGNPLSQFAASVAGGVAAPLSVSAVKSIPAAAKSAVEFLAPGISKAQAMPEIDIAISRIIEPSGLKFSDLSNSVRDKLREDIANAIKTGSKLDENALRRLADYRMTGATPTRATISLDPVEITRQKNAAKFGVNSSDPKLQQLGQIENANNRAIIAKLNEFGGTPEDKYAAAEKVMARLNSLDAAAKARIDAAYEAARGTSGRQAFIDPSAFTQRANDMLDEAMLGGVIPADVRSKLNGIAEGKIPLTVDVAEQFKTNLGNIARDSNERSVKKALGMIRQALDDAPLLPADKINSGNLPGVPGSIPKSPLAAGQESIDAFNEARRLNRSWMSIVDRVPALQAVRDGVEPDKFVNDFIIGNGSRSSVMDTAQLKSLIKDSEPAMKAVRGQIIAHLKEKALGGASDEIGNVSQSNLNKAIQSIGDRKLSLFFSKPEIEQIKAAARVASYEQVQPRGSAVNNSNTAGAALATIFDKIANSPLVGRIPFAPQMAGNVSASIAARKALNAPTAAVIKESQPKTAPYLLPAVAVSGLLTK